MPQQKKHILWLFAITNINTPQKRESVWEEESVDLGGRRLIKKKKKKSYINIRKTQSHNYRQYTNSHIANYHVCMN